MTTAMTSPTLPPLVLACLPAPRHFLLRPQRLTRLSALPRAGLSRWLPAPIDCVWSTLEDVRVSAGTLGSQRFSRG
jgi:hypothetical protein